MISLYDGLIYSIKLVHLQWLGYNCLIQRHEGNPIWNEFFELEVEDLEDQKVVIVLLDEGASQEFQVLGYAQFYLQVSVPS